MKKVLSLLIIAMLGTTVFSGTPQNTRAVKLNGKITFDGKLDEAAWQQAPDSPALVEMKGGGKVDKSLQTTFKVLYDDKGVYFGIRSSEPETKKIKKNAPKVIDAKVWTNDDVEVFIDPIGDRVEYYQFAASPGGAKCDLYLIESGNTGKAGYNPAWQSKSFIGKDYYSTEIFIPFAALNNRKLKSGKQDWIISVTRQRLAGKKSRYTLFNAGGKQGFHNTSAWGKVKGITVPAGRYNIYADSPSASVAKTASGYKADLAINVLNRGLNRKVTVQAEIDGKSIKSTVQLSGNKVKTVEVPALKIATQGIKEVKFSISEADTGKLLYTNIAILNLKYEPIVLRVTQPVYRNTIYFTQKINNILADVKLNMPPSKLNNAKLAARFTTVSGKKLWSKSYKITNGSDKINLIIPAEKLTLGAYQLQVKLIGKNGDELEKTAADIYKLGNAPGVEARIDRKGNTIVNGVPLFVRGWYGNYIYRLAPISMAGIRMPRSINFLMGGDNVDSTRLGFSYTIGLSRIPGLEEAAKAHKKLPESVKKAVLKKIAENKYNRNAIGYYLSDEPECRGLSPETLQELYQLIKKADPYRFCLIVSRAPAEYWQACDVICPHPYNNPIINQQGKRVFSMDYADIHRKMQEGYKATAGKGKGLWVMPQIFSYGFNNKAAVDPNFEQGRWSIYSGVANHATGVVPFIFCNYWNDIENRIGVSYIFETLAWLEPAWTEGSNQKTLIRCSNGGTIDVLTKKYTSNGQTHIYIVAANRSDKKTKVDFTIFGANRYKRLFVLRENRVVPLKQGKFSDTFAVDGVHIYTSCDQIPLFKSLKQIKREIAKIKSYPKTGKNLLRNGKINWQRGVNGRDNRIYGDSLADGNFDSHGWQPWYGSRKELNLVFPNGIKFSKLTFYSNNLKTARLEIWSFGKWRELAKWDDIHKFKTTWQGKMQDTVKLRLMVDKVRLGRKIRGGSIPCITEIEME